MGCENGFTMLKKSIIDKGLCTGCGTCIGVCPSQCIHFEKDQIQRGINKCIECGQCLANCPGQSFDYNENNKLLFGAEYNDKSILGTYKNIYVGYSNSKEIREKAASGGVISEIAAFLISKHYVDGVVVVAAQESGLGFEVKIAKSIEEVYGAAQSKYAIIPTNEIIRTILNEDGRYAYIGLPCQIHGIRKAMKNNPELRKRIAIVIGLFCGFNMNSGATEYLIAKSNIKKEDVIKLEYRKKWNNDTGFYIESKDKCFFVPKHEYTFLNMFFSPKRCLMCYDYSGEFSDISVGDAWEAGLGYSRVITRSNYGQEIIEELCCNNKVVLEESSEETIKNSQKKIIDHKKRYIWYRLHKNKYVPDINIRSSTDSVSIMAKIEYFLMHIGRNAIGRKLLYLAPFKLLRKISAMLRK